MLTLAKTEVVAANHHCWSGNLGGSPLPVLQLYDLEGQGDDWLCETDPTCGRMQL